MFLEGSLPPPNQLVIIAREAMANFHKANFQSDLQVHI